MREIMYTLHGEKLHVFKRLKS